MQPQIKTLESIYNELKMMFNVDYPAMVDLNKTIEELKSLQINGMVVKNMTFVKNINECPVCVSKQADETAIKFDIPNKIINKVANVFGCSVEDILSKKRKSHIVRARHLVSYILMKELKLSSILTGNFLNKDHATILHSCKKALKLSDTKKDFCDKKEAIYNFFGYFSTLDKI